MSVFPDTPAMLLARLAAAATGEAEDDWTRFFAQYEPVIRRFAASLGAFSDSEDVAQEIFRRLVEVFRAGTFRPERGRFRAYLAAMIRNEVVNRWHRARARAAGRTLSLDDDAFPLEVGVPSDTPARIDARWRAACEAAAVEHVLTRTALSARSRAIYRAYVLEGGAIDAVARRFGVSNNAVSQVKTRVTRMIAAYLMAFDA